MPRCVRFANTNRSHADNTRTVCSQKTLFLQKSANTDRLKCSGPQWWRAHRVHAGMREMFKYGVVQIRKYRGKLGREKSRATSSDRYRLRHGTVKMHCASGVRQLRATALDVANKKFMVRPN
jgi:hypothetical protein